MRGRRGFWWATIALLLIPIPAWPQKHQVPAPQRDFTIFFGRDLPVISASDKAVIAQAAMNAKNLMGLRGKVDVRDYVDYLDVKGEEQRAFRTHGKGRARRARPRRDRCGEIGL